jgi:hypothetical protein
MVFVSPSLMKRANEGHTAVIIVFLPVPVLVLPVVLISQRTDLTVTPVYGAAMAIFFLNFDDRSDDDNNINMTVRSAWSS